MLGGRGAEGEGKEPFSGGAARNDLLIRQLIIRRCYMGEEGFCVMRCCRVAFLTGKAAHWGSRHFRTAKVMSPLASQSPLSLLLHPHARKQWWSEVLWSLSPLRHRSVYSSNSISSWKSGSIILISRVNTLLACWLSGIRSPEWAGGSLMLQL